MRCRRKSTVGSFVVVFVSLFVQAPAAAQQSGGSAFLIETAGATVGSAVGFGVALAISRPDECGDDLACTLEKIGVSLLVSAAGATVGDVLTGRMAETRPSTAGAAIGSVTGILAGIGLVHLFSEELDLARSDAVLFVTYSLTQGVVTALGSRIGAWIRD